MCLDCAVAHSQSRHSHGGHFLKILCSRNIRALERRAKYLEEHSLLKGRTAGVHLTPHLLYRLLPRCLNSSLAVLAPRVSAIASACHKPCEHLSGHAGSLQGYDPQNSSPHARDYLSCGLSASLQVPHGQACLQSC